jgi:hypothetical protein
MRQHDDQPAYTAGAQALRQRQQFFRFRLYERGVAAVAVSLALEDDHRAVGVQPAGRLQTAHRQRKEAAQGRRQRLLDQGLHAGKTARHQRFAQHRRAQPAAAAQDQQRGQGHDACRRAGGARVLRAPQGLLKQRHPSPYALHGLSRVACGATWRTP